MSLLEIYVERAAQCRQEAACTTLAKVRERCLRSAIAWEALADRLRTAEMYRACATARKAEQVTSIAATAYSHLS